MSQQSSPGWRPHDHAQASVLRPEHLLREARRQKGLPERNVPEVCVLDPDGDLVRFLRRTGQAPTCPGWACYHTDMLEFDLGDGATAGVVGCAVGAPFAVLVAEQMFASGCRFLVSVTSAGQIANLGALPCVVLIDRALRDEGTSSHYLLPGAGDFVAAPDLGLLARVESAARDALEPRREFEGSTAFHRGATWTTDAPYRETEAAIVAARTRGALAVEMEASALYAFAAARGVPVVCFAHVTNTMGQHGRGDFEKGEANGTVTVWQLIAAAVRAFRASHASGGGARSEPIR
jgi:uridine phosphorylase